MAEVHYAKLLTFKRERISFKNFGQYKLRRYLTRKTHFPERPYKVRLDLVLHAADGGSSGKRPRVGEPVQYEFQSKKMVAMRMSDVNRDEILATLGEPVDQILRMLDRQKSINEDGIVLAVNQRNGVGNPGQIFRAWRKSLSDTRTLLRQDLPIQVHHKIVPPLWFRISTLIALNFF